ncbi:MULTISPECIES: CHC2 zinc finger domain-containing protein [Clostridia]|uniref:CHC2 zinc finger domain-containing protein n=1 Tax=Clostridia TaxID=186801 RepID=UPI0015F8D281|nr:MULTISPECIES: CHC2 zinc finger domain-containing protein [Clostridia]MBC3533287.1 DNA primase [Blautia massiliensis (ex Durand et al. 2017)]
MNIFSEVKEHLITRQVAESYGLHIRRNGTACCPFHDDRHPSMKVDQNYHCFACGVGGDVIDYTARMYGLSQYDAAKKLIEDFGLPIHTEAMSREEKERLRREKEDRMRIIQIKKKFSRWCEETIELLKDAMIQIEYSGELLYGKPPDVIFSEDYAMMLHAEPIINYWLDILCMGSEQEKKELFMQGRKEVEQVAGNVRKWSRCIMGRCQESA